MYRLDWADIFQRRCRRLILNRTGHPRHFSRHLTFIHYIWRVDVTLQLRRVFLVTYRLSTANLVQEFVFLFIEALKSFQVVLSVPCDFLMLQAAVSLTRQLVCFIIEIRLVVIA